MRSGFLFVAVGVCVVGLLRCTDEEQSTETVYVAGLQSADNLCKGLLWVQGSAVSLTDEISCTNFRGVTGPPSGLDVVVSGSDVFVVGITDDGKGAIWRNEVPELLPNFESNDAAIPRSLYVNGSDVYIAGFTYSGNYSGLVWKNGVVDTLLRPDIVTGLNVKFQGIDGHGADLAVAGTVYTNDYMNAVYWLNGNPTVLDTLRFYPYGEGNDVAITEDGVFVAGTLFDDRLILKALSRPAVWHNGTLKVLAISGVANGIFVNNDDVYVAGRELTLPVYWKNDEEGHPLPMPPEYVSGTATAIFVLGNDVYVAGGVYKEKEFFAVYWKNDVMVMLDRESYTTGLYVAPR